MSRLPELDPKKFSPEQKKVHEAILKGPRGKVVGPLKVWLNNPGLAEHAQALGAYARFNSSLPPRLSELAICVTGAFWKANFEWYAHAPLAIKAGIDPAAIEAIRTGGTPKLTKSDEPNGFVSAFIHSAKFDGAGPYAMRSVVPWYGPRRQTPVHAARASAIAAARTWRRRGTTVSFRGAPRDSRPARGSGRAQLDRPLSRSARAARRATSRGISAAPA